jgi:hypothetical protein
LELVVEIIIDGEPDPLEAAGSEIFESNGVPTFAPLTPNTVSPLYSPPYWKLAHPEIDSVTTSFVSLFALVAQNSAI